MNWLKKLIHGWASEGRALRRGLEVRETVTSNPILGSGSVDHAASPKMRIGFIDAMNGRILEVATAVQHPHHTGHCDWKVELFIVPEDQNLSEALAMLMLLKGAK